MSRQRRGLHGTRGHPEEEKGEHGGSGGEGKSEGLTEKGARRSV